MDRRVVIADTHAVGLHLLHERRTGWQAILALRQYQLEQVPVAVFEVGRRQLRAVLGFEIAAKAFEVVSCQVLTMGGDLLDVRKLPQAYGGGNVGHVELATQHIHIQAIEAAAGDALQSVLLCQTGLLGIVQHQAAAFGRRDVLVRLEAEGHEVASCADAFSIPAGPQGLGSIFDNTQVVLVGQRVEHRHIHRQAGQVDRDDRLGARSNGRFYLGQVDIACHRVDVGKDRSGADFENHVGRGNPGDWGGDDFIPRPDPGDAQGDLHGAGARVEGAHRTSAKIV